MTKHNTNWLFFPQKRSNVESVKLMIFVFGSFAILYVSEGNERMLGFEFQIENLHEVAYISCMDIYISCMDISWMDIS